MDLALRSELGRPYKSLSQKSRIITESWAAVNLYCIACPSDSVRTLPNNSEAVDFLCPSCQAGYQLKAANKKFGSKVQDASFDAMMRAIRRDRFPHLLLLHYDQERWLVENLMVIPSFLISSSAVEARRPLRATARRAGWVGCNIILDKIPGEGRIALVSNGRSKDARQVRSTFISLSGLGKLPILIRGWTLDVFTNLSAMYESEFSLHDAYQLEDTLSELHPENRNVRAKVRQQLQILRDLNLLEFVSRGRYQWKKTPVVQ